MTDWVREQYDRCHIRQARTALKTHRCQGHECHHLIRPGERYMVYVELPGGEAGYADSAGHPVSMRACAACHSKYDPAKLAELGERTDARSLIEAQIAKWADDFSFASPADLAEQLRKALDGGQ